ncbi:LabA-like NYN domain-containing protein [Roseivivax sp. CAU 1761]
MFYNSDRLALLIDGKSLYTATKSLGIAVDYARLKSEFAKRGKLIHAYFYTAVDVEAEFDATRKTVDWLDYNGFVTRTKPIKRRHSDDGSVKLKTNMNVEMATDAFELAERVDHVVLFTGDGDMKPVVELLKRRGVRVTVVATLKGVSQTISDELRRAADSFIDLSDLAPLLAREPRAHGNDARQDSERAA